MKTWFISDSESDAARAIAMVTKKIRTEYMKKFRDPRWDSFSKCYEDSLRYRLTRRVMEHSHKPWSWDGWDGSDSSGGSTPKLSRNKVVPLSVKPPPTNLGFRRDRLAHFRPPPEPKPPSASVDPDVDARGPEDVEDASSTGAITGNGPSEINRGPVKVTPDASPPPDSTETDAGPAACESSDEERVRSEPRRRLRQRPPPRPPAAAPGGVVSENGVARKPPRAKSQPAVSAKENGPPSGQLQIQSKVMADACVQTTRRCSDKRGSNPERRRARSADLEKASRSELTVADGHWMTEYMRCFSARLR